MSTATYLYLHRVADRLEKPGAWTQGCLARDGGGLSCDVADAVSVCALGAMCAELDTSWGPGVIDHPMRWTAWAAVMNTLFKLNGKYIQVAIWNDYVATTQSDVVAMFRAAANSLKPVSIETVVEKVLEPA